MRSPRSTEATSLLPRANTAASWVMAARIPPLTPPLPSRGCAAPPRPCAAAPACPRRSSGRHLPPMLVRPPPYPITPTLCPCTAPSPVPGTGGCCIDLLKYPISNWSSNGPDAVVNEEEVLRSFVCRSTDLRRKRPRQWQSRRHRWQVNGVRVSR
jgi:hypothetical protein